MVELIVSRRVSCVCQSTVREEGGGSEIGAGRHCGKYQITTSEESSATLFSLFILFDFIDIVLVHCSN